MTRYYPPPHRGGLLAVHLGRLGLALGGLTDQTRQAVARAMAQAAADLVGDAVRTLLAAPEDRRGSYWPDRAPAYRDPWNDEVDDRYGFSREYPEERWERDGDPPGPRTES